MQEGCAKYVEAVAVQVTSCSIWEIRKYLISLKALGKPVWITRVECPSGTQAQNAKLLTEFDSTVKHFSYVHRYFWSQVRQEGKNDVGSNLLSIKSLLTSTGIAFAQVTAASKLRLIPTWRRDKHARHYEAGCTIELCGMRKISNSIIQLLRRMCTFSGVLVVTDCVLLKWWNQLKMR